MDDFGHLGFSMCIMDPSFNGILVRIDFSDPVNSVILGFRIALMFGVNSKTPGKS